MNYNERIEICKACEHYSSIGTCGTPIVGNTVVHEGEEYTLRGGFAHTKAKVEFLSCPLSKWKGFITEKERIELQDFLRSSIETGQVDIQKISYWWNKTHPNKHFNASACPPCNSAKVDELWQQVKERRPSSVPDAT